MLNKNLISEKVNTIIKDNIDKRENVNLKKTFEDIGIGSLSFVKIMVEIEILFRIEISNEYYIANYKNIGEFIDKIADYLLRGEDHGN